MAKFKKEIFKIDWFIAQFREFIEQPSYTSVYTIDITKQNTTGYTLRCGNVERNRKTAR